MFPEAEAKRKREVDEHTAAIVKRMKEDTNVIVIESNISNVEGTSLTRESIRATEVRGVCVCVCVCVCVLMIIVLQDLLARLREANQRPRR